MYPLHGNPSTGYGFVTLKSKHDVEQLLAQAAALPPFREKRVGDFHRVNR